MTFRFCFRESDLSMIVIFIRLILSGFMDFLFFELTLAFRIFVYTFFYSFEFVIDTKRFIFSENEINWFFLRFDFKSISNFY